MIQQHEFWDREMEMKYLKEKYESGKSELLIIYGRRRIGKTKILEKFIENFGGIYFLAARTSVRENIERFAGIVAENIDKDYIKSLQKWEEIFSALLEVGNEKRIVIVIDEFPYLLEIDRSVVYEFQRLWDTLLSKDRRIFLILCGSSISVMENNVLSYRSPLYGRRTGSWKVESFKIEDFFKIFPDKNISDLVKIWSIFGRVPDYLKEYESNRSLEWNIKNKILKKGSYLYNEPEILLRQEFREPRNLFLIMKSIAEGNYTVGKIQNAAGIDKGNISKYLSMLINTELIEYEKIYGKRRRRFYTIKDNFFEFWFRYAYPYMSELEIGNIDEIYKRINFENYFGYAFEKFIREAFKMEGYVTYRYIFKGEEIDIVAESSSQKEIVLCEVKWGNANRWDAKGLIKKSEKIKVPVGYRKKHILFCKNYRGREIENVEIVRMNELKRYFNIQE